MLVKQKEANTEIVHVPRAMPLLVGADLRKDLAADLRKARREAKAELKAEVGAKERAAQAGTRKAESRAGMPAPPQLGATAQAKAKTNAKDRDGSRCNNGAFWCGQYRTHPAEQCYNRICELCQSTGHSGLECKLAAWY